MAQYSYINPKTKKTITLVQSMNEPHIYIDKNGVAWERVFEAPQAQIDTKIDPFSGKDFVNKTRNKNMTVGDSWDLSLELSESRKKKAGNDTVKEKTIKDYETKCKRKHPLA